MCLSHLRLPPLHSLAVFLSFLPLRTLASQAEIHDTCTAHHPPGAQLRLRHERHHLARAAFSHLIVSIARSADVQTASSLRFLIRILSTYAGPFLQRRHFIGSVFGAGFLSSSPRVQLPQSHDFPSILCVRDCEFGTIHSCLASWLL